MEESQQKEQEKWNANDYRLALVRLKGLTIVALKQLETLKDENIPTDAEFREILFSLITNIVEEGNHIDEMLEDFHLPSVDDAA